MPKKPPPSRTVSGRGGLGFPIIEIAPGFWPDVKVAVDDLRRLNITLKDFKEPLNKSLREVIIPSIKQNFKSEGRPPWQPLSDDTVRIRGSSHPILKVKGLLLRRSTQLNMWRITKDSLTSPIGPIISYAVFHQGGTRTMPARPFIMYQDEDRDAIERIFNEWLERKIRTVGGFR